jgi:hypothetical protein
MKSYLIFIILVLSLYTNILSQPQFIRRIVADFYQSRSVYTKDLDSDGDIDVISGSSVRNQPNIAWFENDGSENFTQHDITISSYMTRSVFAIDVDGDQEIDIIAGSDQKVAWYENDGNENFTRHIIWIPQRAHSVFAIDIDGDDDIDILSAAMDKLVWHENDGNEHFTTYVLRAHRGYTSVYAIDVDGDEDIDVLSTSMPWSGTGENEIAWYENDGSENFTHHIITANVNDPSSVFALDLDGDDDTDVLSASYWDHEIAWYENDGNENFMQHSITTDCWFAVSVYAADLDNDGDTDVLSAANGNMGLGSAIAWYENDGNENFTNHIIAANEEGAKSIYAADMDGDNDIDLLSAGHSGNDIFWYENTLIVGVDDNNPTVTPAKFKLFNNYPNPFNPITKIKYQLPEISFVTIKVYDVLGNEIATLVNEEKPAGEYNVEFRIDNLELTSGIYFYQLRASDPSTGSGQGFVETKKMVLLK